MLDGVRRRLALPGRLLLVAALEHVAAVLSRRYLDQGDEWVFRSPYARRLFTLHARQELAHRSVVFDLCLSHGAAGRLGRALAMAAVLLGGLGYVAAAVPWIVYRKSGRRWGPALALLAGGVWRNSLRGSSWATLGELLSFSRGAYHPDRMAAAADASIK
jgi:predicted metal-dependent hydrolase